MTAPALRPRYASTDPEALVAQHLQLVRRLAWHVHARFTSALEVEDLLQIGLLTLVEVARTYEDRGFAFATYASTRIKGAMIDALRRAAEAPRGGAAARRRLDTARGRVAARLGGAPADEVARELGLDRAEYDALERAAQSVERLPIDEVGDTHPALADDRHNVEEWIDDDRTRHMLGSAIATLPEREQLVLQLYFHEELNLEEIGSVLGVSAARVCQIKRDGLQRLKRKLSLPVG